MTRCFHQARWPLITTSMLASMTVSGCISLAPPSIAPDIENAVPAAYDAGAQQSADGQADGVYQPDQWWAAFEDPVLDDLLEVALGKNLDITEAAARLQAAEAQARISKSGLFPQLNAGADGRFSSSPLGGTAFGSAAGGFGLNRLEFETYSSSLAFSYELDIWGKLRNDARSGRASAIASAADVQAVRMAVMAETITSYFDLVDARHQIALTTQIIDVLNDRLQQTEERYRRGLVTSFELYQVRQDFRNNQASLPAREKQRAAIISQLAVLTGQYSPSMKPMLAQALTPQLVFEPIPAGLPINLLGQRPDIAAEGLRLEAARFNVGARRAERFPSLGLSAGTGTQGGAVVEALDAFDTWVLNLGANITAPLFQGGRIRANIAVADAQYSQQAAVYARTVLTAYQEVEAAIAGYQEDRQRYRLVFSQLDEAMNAAALQSQRFARGVGSYVDYLDALRAQYQVQSALSSAARDVALSRLAVHRALGGGWVRANPPKTDSGDIPADMPQVSGDLRPVQGEN